MAENPRLSSLGMNGMAYKTCKEILGILTGEKL
jgi:hypothetical protein